MESSNADAVAQRSLLSHYLLNNNPSLIGQYKYKKNNNIKGNKLSTKYKIIFV